MRKVGQAEKGEGHSTSPIKLVSYIPSIIDWEAETFTIDRIDTSPILCRDVARELQTLTTFGIHCFHADFPFRATIGQRYPKIAPCSQRNNKARCSGHRANSFRLFIGNEHFAGKEALETLDDANIQAKSPNPTFC